MDAVQQATLDFYLSQCPEQHRTLIRLVFSLDGAIFDDYARALYDGRSFPTIVSVLFDNEERKKDFLKIIRKVGYYHTSYNVYKCERTGITVTATVTRGDNKRSHWKGYINDLYLFDKNDLEMIPHETSK